MSVPIVPCLWFPDCAEEAMEFYCSVFPDSRILSIERYPDESLDEHFKGMSGKVLTGADQAELDHYWSNLSASPDHEQCGWLKDRFGVSWQIVPANLGELMTGPAQTQALMQMKKIVIDDLVNAG